MMDQKEWMNDLYMAGFHEGFSCAISWGAVGIAIGILFWFIAG